MLKLYAINANNDFGQISLPLSAELYEVFSWNNDIMFLFNIEEPGDEEEVEIVLVDPVANPDISLNGLYYIGTVKLWHDTQIRVIFERAP